MSSGSRKSRLTKSLPPLMVSNSMFSSFEQGTPNGVAKKRCTSPFGGSTLMTRAPCVASTLPHAGTAK